MYNKYGCGQFFLKERMIRQREKITWRKIPGDKFRHRCLCFFSFIRYPNLLLPLPYFRTPAPLPHPPPPSPPPFLSVLSLIDPPFLNRQTFRDIFIDISHILYYNIYSYLISRCKKNFTPVPPPRIAQSGPGSPANERQAWRTFGSF